MKGCENQACGPDNRCPYAPTCEGYTDGVKGIRIYECELTCDDCNNEVGSHNMWHLPYCDFEFFINLSEEAGRKKLENDYDCVRLIESYTEKEVKNSLNGLFPKGYSWTQLAIARCNELAR